MASLTSAPDKFFARLFLLIVGLSCIAIMTGSAMAQNGSTPLALTPGVPAGSYALSNIDTVNLYSGRINIHIPLGADMGRGGANSSASLTWDAPVGWHVVTYYGDQGAGPYYYAEADADGADAFTTNGVHLGGMYIHMKSSGMGANFCDVGAFGYNFYIRQQTTTRLWFVDETGTEHEMRDVATGGQPLYAGNCWSNYGPNRGTIFVSTDGSGATYIADGAIRDGFVVDNEWPSGGGGGGWLLLKDGRKYQLESGGALRDRNGNMLVMGVKDSLNRQPLIDAGASPSECTSLGAGASEYCQKLSTKGFAGMQRLLWVAYDSLYRPLYVVLPNNLKYRFYYNDYGDVTRVDLPTGGSIEYTYEPGLTGTQTDYSGVQGGIPGTYGTTIYRRLTERRLYREGHTLESRETFSKPESTTGNNLGYVERKQFDAGDILLGSERHFFYGSAFSSLGVTGMSFAAWRDGREYHTETYDQNGNLLRQVDQTWEQRAPISWWTGGADSAPQNDPRVTEVITRLENGLTSKVGYGYDQSVPYNSVTDVYEYDFGSGTPGALLRHIQTSYLKWLNGVDYSGSSIQDHSSPHMRDFPMQVSVFNSTGAERSRTSYEYDNYSTDTNHAGLFPRANISGLDPAYTTSFTTRGNVTGTTNYLIENGSVIGSVSAYVQYDVAGNVVKTIDTRGFGTSLYYDDSFGSPNGEARANTAPNELSSVSQASYAFATSATNALGQTAYSQFDYYLGVPIETEDATGLAGLEDGRGVVSSLYYDDLLDRPTRMIHGFNRGAPIRNRADVSYDDVNRFVTVTGDLTDYNDAKLKSQSFFDGLGRSIETRTYENSAQFITVKSIPFIVLQDPDTGAWMQASQSSNPYRTYLGEQPVWTSSFMDSLGRMSKLQTPDTAIVRTYYDGARTLVVDALGKERLSLTNAVGQQTSVWEITVADGETEGVSFPNHSEVTAGYCTNYEYDLGFLSKVIQGTQPQRTFVYDTLGRLNFTSNPENGYISYQYDAGGNVLVKSDARGVSSHYSFDALNRPLRRWYNGSNSVWATTNNSPALPAGVGASNEVNYFYDAQDLPTGAPSFVRGPSTGHLIAATYGGSSSGDYFGFDTGGREVVKIQQTAGVNYQVTAAYNVSGRVTSGVYPSQHGVSYTYDGAGRLSSFAGSLGDNAQRTYTTGIAYSALGGLSQEQFGTAAPIYNKLFYNVRGQLAEIREGTTPNNTNWERGAIINFYSGCWGMCSGQAMPDNNGNLKRQEHWVQDSSGNVVAVNSQSFDYDSLNRLKRVYEGSASQPTWQQTYLYDRFGNRRLDTNATTASLSPKAFELQTATNRLLAPGDTNLPEANRQMRYDAVGNLTTDNYTGQGQRTYDAENHMTSAGSAGSLPATYTYDANGQRVRRNVNGVETWQVYGLGGELLAEYAANASALTPQKEYGYRNGQLLIVASVTTGWGSQPVLHDNPLVVGETTVQLRHITELRDAINALRSHLGMSVFSWLQPAATGGLIKADPIIEMRAALDQALGAPSPAYSAGLSQGQVVKAIHIQELRNRVVAAWVTSGSNSTNWLVSDQLGTPRIVFDETGALANVKRHDYLPFGEDLVAGARATTPGYSGADGVRQKFTGYEHDDETKLEFAHARYFATQQGRFTGVDPMSGQVADPQSWNRYAYVGNNPVNITDPTGMNYFVGGGVNDPEIYQDGFYVGPQGTASQLTKESMVGVYSQGPDRAQGGKADEVSGGTEGKADGEEVHYSHTQDNGYEVFVLSNADELEKQTAAGNVQYLDANGIAQCARLPLVWEIDQEGFILAHANRGKRLTDNWKMGDEAVFGMNLRKGTVLATFNRQTGKYSTLNSGQGGENHTVAFLRWEIRNNQQGMVVAQQMSGRNGRAEIGFVPFEKDAPYFRNAYRFNVVTIPKQSMGGFQGP
jgi:RHS repeat-associated protein